MPFWKDITPTRQLLGDSLTLAVNKITSDQDIARLQNDAQVWSVNHLAKVISGDDPMQAIVDLVGQVPRFFGYLFRPIQNGLVQFYALAMVLGVAVFLIALAQALIR